jgi:hypothetical protein
MLPPSLAIGWTFWQRHRWGLLAVLTYLVLAVAAAALVPALFERQVALRILGGLFAALVPAFLHLVGVFAYGYDADNVNARESCFPEGLFTLPVKTGALALWPMAYGAAAVGVLWLIAARFLLEPWIGLVDNVALPLWWPAMLAVACLAWVQALLWAPFGLPGLRVLLMVILIPGMVVATNYSIESGASEGLLVGVFACVAAVGWAVGYSGVSHARRGDLPDWRGVLSPLRQVFRRQPRRRRPFGSAARAQVWFEWRRTGLSLSFMTALVLPFVFWPLAFGKNDVLRPAQVLVGALAVPWFFAGIAGTMVSGKHPWVKDYYGVAPSTATLPVTTAALVAAKLKAAALSTLAAWMLLLAAASLAVVLTGNVDEVVGWWRSGLREHHALELLAGLLACLILLIVWTWKRMEDNLLVGLTGRAWVIRTCAAATVVGTVALGILGSTILLHPGAHATVRAVLPWLLGGVVLCRLLAAGWAVRVGLHHGLLAWRTVAGWAAGWLLVALALWGVLAWVVPAEVVSRYYLAVGVVWCLPMARLAATPLALAWNRHR